MALDPRYRNETDGSITPPGGGTVAPNGEFGGKGRYLVNTSGLTKISDIKPPWEELYVGTTPATITGLAKWSQLEIINMSGGVIDVYGNNSSEHPFHMVNGSSKILTHDRQIDALEFAGEGAENIYLVGWWRV